MEWLKHKIEILYLFVLFLISILFDKDFKIR